MAELLAATIAWLKGHVGVLVMGFLGASLNALISKDSYSDRLVGALAGLIMVIALADPASQFFADGNYPELFGFVLGASGKSTAELLLDKIRTKIKDKIAGE